AEFVDLTPSSFPKKRWSIADHFDLRGVELIERAAADASQPKTQQRSSSQQSDAAGPRCPTPGQVGQRGAHASSQIVERHVESGGGGAGAPCDRASLHRG